MNRKQWRANRIIAIDLERIELSKQITNLEICNRFHEADLNFISLRECGNAFHGHAGKVVLHAMARARDEGLIVSCIFEHHGHYGELAGLVPGYRLTDAGRHIATTSVTGKSARETLNEIEAEMAGQA